MAISRKIVITAAIVLTVLVGGVGAWWAVMWVAGEPEPMDVSGMRGVIVTSPALNLPKFQLLDGDNRPLTNDSLKKRWTLLYFGYTHCPDICPTTLQTLSRVVAELDPATRADTQVMFVSLDPKRDTPATLKEYIAHFNAGFIAATAQKPYLDVLAEPLGVIYEFVGDIKGDEYGVDHYGAVFILDPKARLRAYILPPHEPPRVLEAYTKVRNYYGARR